MFEVVQTLLIQLINILPFLIPFILIMNLVCSMLFDRKQVFLMLFYLGSVIGFLGVASYTLFKENQDLKEKLENKKKGNK